MILTWRSLPSLTGCVHRMRRPACGAQPAEAVVGPIFAIGAGPTASFVDGFSRPARMVLAALMLVGRLELFPMLLMFAAPYRAVEGAFHRSSST